MKSDENTNPVEEAPLKSTPESSEWEPLKDFPGFEVNTKTEEIRDSSTKEIKKPFQRKSDKRFLIKLGSVLPYYYRVKAKQFLPNPWNYPEVDHIDRNPSNNSIDNLRFVSRTLNKMNRSLEWSDIVQELPCDSILVTEFKDWKFFEPDIDYSYHFSPSIQTFYLQISPTTFKKEIVKNGYVKLRDVSGIRRRIKVSTFL
jgi:hypothetical protein